MEPGEHAESPRRGRVKVAVVGVGLAGQSHLFDAVSDEERFEVLAVCGRRSARVEDVAQRFAVPRAYTDLGVLMQHETEVELFVLALPPDTLALSLQRVVQRGCAVLVEKPGAVGGDELERAASGSAPRFLYNRRYRRAWHAAREWIGSGRIGTIRNVDACWRADFAARHDDAAPTYRAGLRAPSRGVLLETGCHILDAIAFTTGSIGDVRACSLMRNARGIDIGARAEFGSRAGRMARLVIEEGEGRRLEILGRRGRIVLDESGATLDCEGASAYVEDAAIGSPVADGLALARPGEGMPPPLGASLPEALAVLRSIDALYRRASSSRSWRPPRAKAWARPSGAC